MKKFIFKIALITVVFIAILSFILMRYGGNVDYFYLKFTTPKQSSFILGDSRSLQGIQPSVVNEYFQNNEFEMPMFNYSFTVTQAAYGPVYTQSVKNKLNESTKNGLFILNVNPWLFAQREMDDYKKGIFMEADNPPHNMRFVSANPNFEYLYKNYDYFHFKSIFRQNSELHKDGWLEEKNLSTDPKVLSEWKKKQMSIYKGFAKRWKKTTFRMASFEKMIAFLEAHGKVVIVRMPIDKEILQIEDDFWSSFDSDMERIAAENDVPYINFSTTTTFKMYDGNHIDKFGGVQFTRQLCDSIKSNR